MFNKRFLTLMMIAVLALVLGTGVFAQEDNANLSHTENPLVSWLHTLSRKFDHVFDADESQLFMKQFDFDSLVERMDTQAFNSLSDSEHPTTVNKTQLQQIRGLVNQWADTLQSWQDGDRVSFVQWFTRLAERLGNLFEQVQPTASLSQLLHQYASSPLLSFQLAK